MSMVCAGRILIKPVLFLVGLLATLIIFSILFFIMFYEPENGTWAYWIAFSVAGIAGIFVGYGSYHCKRAASACLGAWTGFSIGNTVFNILVYRWSNTEWAYWSLNIFIIACVLAVSIMNTDRHLIWMSSFFGSSLFCRSLSVFTGHYPTDFNMA